ncbi:putative internal virion-like protein [Escherichia phage ECBP5]|uniref:Putative internal virion-like protein n=1 Tax=Escherichia phage ECBP5 TaxID=1498172 RepID=A0A0F6N5P4_9CAUD|nr:putative internal virion-like protein [Escherichia phage ECBP5]AID17698.1 putative internal virion-like protein [Escherichia phage ECBP5]
MAETSVPQEQSFGDLFGAAARNNWILQQKQQSEDLMTYGTPVEGYKPSYEDVSKITTDYKLTDEQSKIISGSMSPEELQYRAKVFKDNNDSKKTLDNAGWKGMAAEVLSYAADPVMLPTYALKTPMVVGQIATKLGFQFSKTAVTGAIERAVGAGIVGGATGLGQEAVLSMYDPNRDVNDVVLAGISGVVGGAAFSSLADGGAAIFERLTAKRQLGRAMDEAVEAFDWDNSISLVNSADHELTGASMGRIENTQYGKYFDMLQGDIPDELARKRVLTEGDAINKMIDDLTPTAEARMSRGQRMEAEAQIKATSHDMEIIAQRLADVEATAPAGSGKALSKARQDRAAELSSLRSQLDDLRAQVVTKQTELAPHATGEYAEAVGDISRLKQGIIPDRLKERYLDLITPEDPAPAFNEAVAGLPPVKDEPVVLPEQAAQEAAKPVEQPDTSIGAAEVKDSIIFPDTEGKEISDTYANVLGGLQKIGEKIPVTKVAGSTALYTRVMAGTKDNTLRGIASLVFNDPHGVKGAPQSAIAFSDTMRTSIMPKAFFIENAAKEQYLKQLGVNPLFQAGKYNEELIKFDRNIMLRMTELTDTVIGDADDAITRAAKARAQAYAESLKLMKRYGVRGFENVEERASYTPVTFGKNDITSALDQFGEDAVREVLARGYMTGKIPLSDKSARLVADNTLERFYRKSGKVAAVKPTESISGKIAEVVNELREGGVADSEIRTVINMLQDKAHDESISARAMQSLHPNLAAETTDGLRFVDLVDSSTASVDKYVRDAAAQAAFAKYGMRSRRQVEDTITEAFKRHRQQLTELTDNYNRAKERLSKLDRSKALPSVVSELEKTIKDYERLGDINKYRKFLDSYEEDFFNGVKVTFGEPVEQANSIAYAASSTGKLVNLMMLGFSGLAQVADLGVTIARSGVGATLRNLPTTLYHGVRSLLPSARYFETNNQLNNMAEIFGTVSHQDYLFGHKMMKGAEYGDAVIGQVSRADKVLDNIGWLQSTMSFLRPMQGMIDELSARSIMTNIVDLSKNGMFTGKVRKSFLELGKMSEDSLDSSMTHIKSQMGSGKDIFEAIRTLDPKLRDELGTAIRTIHTFNIGRSYYGELPAFTNQSLGKIFMKLQSFALVAYEKSIQRGFRNDQAGLVAATAWSAGLAYLWSEVDVRAQSLKQPEAKRDEYVRKRLEDEMAYTVAGRMSQLAVLSTLAQVMNVANPYQDSVLKPFGEYRGVAAGGAIGKVGQAAAAGTRLATDQSVDPDADMYKVYGAVPLLNTAIGMAILNTL